MTVLKFETCMPGSLLVRIAPTEVLLHGWRTAQSVPVALSVIAKNGSVNVSFRSGESL